MKSNIVRIGLVLFSLLFASLGSASGVPENMLKGKIRTNLDSVNPTPSQVERKKKYTEKVRSLGLPVLETLPLTEDPSSIPPRSKEEIANRAIAVALAAVKAEGMPQEQLNGIIRDWNAANFFSVEEKEFIEKQNPSKRELAKYSWRYEGLDVLLWALGYKESLPAPHEICDVKSDVGIIVKETSRTLATNAKLRTMSEIMDMADYYYRLHWAAVELRINGKSSNVLHEGVVMERHYALNWLIRYMGQDWDSVTTDT